MKKTKFSKFLVFVLVVVMACSMIILTACDNTTPHKNQPNKTGNDEQVVKNGDFTFTTGDSYPKTPSNWSGSIGGNGTYQPAGGLDAIKTGVINVGVDYEDNKSKWDNLAVDSIGKYDASADDYMLMIYNSSPSSYSYLCDNLTIDANKYYKLTFYAKTVGLSGEMDGDKPKDNTTYGAYINVSGGNVRGEWIDIDTKGEWKQFEMYIEGGNTANNLRITFGLGYGDNTDRHLTKGYAFFDNAKLETVEKTVYDEVKVADQVPSEAGQSYIRKDSFKLSNANFVSYNKFYTSIPSNPIGWSSGYGGIEGDVASDIPSSEKADVNRGIVNFDKLDGNNTKYGFKSTDNLKEKGFVLRPNAIDNSALLLNANKDYSINYVANSKILIEKGKTYQIKVWVKTLNTVEGKTATGSIVLSNDDEKYTVRFDDKKVYRFDGDKKLEETNIADTTATNGWSQIVLNVRGNSTHDVTYNLTLALGTDGKSKKENWSCGHILFDDITITEKISEPTLTGWAVDNSANNMDIDLNKTGGKINNGIENGNFTGAINDQTVNGANYKIPAGFTIVDDSTTAKFKGGIKVSPFEAKDLPFNVIYNFSDTVSEQVVANNVIEINATSASTIKIKHDSKLTAVMNKHYRLSFWVKTADMAKTAGMNFTVKVYDKDGMAGENVVQTITIDNVNSANIDEKNDRYNGWQEVVFYIAGEPTMNREYSFEMSYGKGDMFDQTISMGSAYIYNINLQPMDLSTFNNASTNNLAKKVEIASTNAPKEDIANGFFNKVVNSSSSFDKETGKLDKFGVPQSWSVYNEAVPSDAKTYKVEEKDPTPENPDNKKTVTKDIEVKKGVLDLTNTGTIFGDKGENIKDVDLSTAIDNLKKDNMFALAIYSDRPTISRYKSNYISLSANSFYSIRIKAYSTKDAIASVRLESSSPHEESDDTLIVQTTTDQNGWTEFVFYVKTGQTSASVNLVVSLGDLTTYKNDTATPKTKGLSSGLALFDEAILIKHTSEDTFNNFVNRDKTDNKPIKELSFNVDGFATNSYDIEKLTSPSGWNTNAVTSPKTINGKPATKVGIINVDRFKASEIWDYDTNGEMDKDKIKTYQDEKTALVNKVKDPANGFREEFGSSILMIDNLIGNGYSVSNSSISISAKKYYKVSIWVYADIQNEDDLGLTLRLKLGDRAQDIKEIANIKSTNKWQQYNFYIKNDSENASNLSASLTLQLGTRQKEGNNDVLKEVKGTVFADNFKITEIEKSAYETAISGDVANNPNQNANIAYEPEKVVNPDEDKKDEENKDKNPVDWSMLAWAIPTIILAVMLIAVLGVFLYKKYANPKKHTKFKDKPKKHKTEVTKKDNIDNFKD